MLPWFARDYIAATRHLSLAERGAYTDLLFLSWEMGPLPNDPIRLARLIGVASAEFKRVWPAIRSKFTEVETGLINNRLEQHRAKATDLTDKRSSAGKQGAVSKWGTVQADHRKDRAARLSSARSIAKHTAIEWDALVEVCGCKCLKCGSGAELIKDHIVPIYQGGSDGIDNLQPLCHRCNSSKGPDCTDHRPPDWKERLTECLAKRPANVVASGLANACYPSPSPSPSPNHINPKSASARISRQNKPESAAVLLAQGRNGKHAAGDGTAESPSTEAATLRRIVLDELGRGVSAAAIIRLMPGRGLTEEQIAQIQREASS